MGEHHVGAKLLPLPPGVTARALYGGPADCYRYELEWVWDPRLPTLMGLLMNPSVAGHEGGDRTALKLWRYGCAWGFGALLLGNVHAYRATDQTRLCEVSDPIGPDNLRHVIAMAQRADLVLVGYGQPKTPRLRRNGTDLTQALDRLGVQMVALRVSDDGTPHHPLYVPEDPARSTPRSWRPK